MTNMVGLNRAQSVAPTWRHPYPCDGRAASSRSSGTVNMMYRVLAIVGSALALTACSSSPDWMAFSALKSGPVLDTVSFESEPPGAEAKASNGQTCRTPCSLALPVEAPLTVTFTLNGYTPAQEQLDTIRQTGEPPRFGTNPVVVELTPAPPPSRTTKKPPSKKPTAKKSAARPAAAAAAPMTAAPAQSASPWPTSPPPPVRQ
jgi:hypothetical protein